MTGSYDDPNVQPDAMAEWCAACRRWHQRRERLVQCLHAGCRTLVDGYHGLCSEHRGTLRWVPTLTGDDARRLLRSAGLDDLTALLDDED